MNFSKDRMFKNYYYVESSMKNNEKIASNFYQFDLIKKKSKFIKRNNCN